MLGHPERTAPHRLGLETCAVAGTMDGLRRPLMRAFEPTPRKDDAPVKVPPLPRPKRKPKAPRFLCAQCGETADHPDQLCLPVPVS